MSFLTWLGIWCILFSPVLSNSNIRYPESHLSLDDLNAPTDYTEYLLPKNLQPISYDLTLTPSLSSSTFDGMVMITFKVNSDTDHIIIHANPNSIPLSGIQANLTVDSNTTQLDNPTSNSTLEFLIFKLTNLLKANQKGVLSIIYKGILGNDMLGFYISTYDDTTGKHAMAITQFESTYARRAFPCFDEPAYRATFLIKIWRSSTQTSMSNMEIDTQTKSDNPDLDLDTYKVSPLMPTYLVAFGVGELSNLTNSNSNFTVYARDNAIQDAAYVESIGQSVLDSIADFVGVPYPLEKMGVVAVSDFDAGAMENWGLTTFREKYVLYNLTLNSWKDKFGVLSVVSHEFGHQWFGDLVTPLWWDFAWLNEAFATYFEYKTSDQLAPEWGMGSTMYVVGAVQYALDADIGNPRPMTAHVYTPSQIENIFDYVIYEKGGSVLRMTENFLTTAVWRDGLNRYLETNKYKTGKPEELFTALQAAANDKSGPSNVNDTLQGWTTQPGYPLITVTLTASNNDNSTYNISQIPYELNGTMANPQWNIPLTYTTSYEPEWDPSVASKQWLLPSDPVTSQVTVTGNGWVIFNIDQIGFYRVNYDAENWGKLKSQLVANFSAIGSINRGQLLDDAFHLARSGHLDYATVLGLTEYLPAESAVAPWNAYFVNMRFLINQFFGTSTGDGLMKYAQTTMRIPFSRLTANLSLTTSTFNSALALQYASQFSCDVRLSDCEDLASSSFENWRNNKGMLIIPEVKQAIICTGLRVDTSLEAFLDVWMYYLASNNGAEKLTLMYAMGCVTNETAINVYLNAVCDVTNNYVRLQDRWIAIRALVSHQTGVSIGLQYIVDNFVNVSNALGSRLPDVIATIGNTISQQKDILQVQSIANNPKVDQKLRNMLKSVALPKITQRQQWVESKQASDLKTWVNSHITKSSASSTVVNTLLVLVNALVFLFHNREVSF